MSRRAGALAAALCLLLAGCGNREPDELSVVRLVTVDRTGETVAAAAYPMEGEERTAFLVNGRGENTAGALSRLETEGRESAFLGHTEHIVTGAEYGDGGVDELLTCAVLGGTLRPDSCIWAMTEGSGADWAERAGGDAGAERLNRLDGSIMLRTAAEGRMDLMQSGATLIPALGPDGTPEGYAVFREGGRAGFLLKAEKDGAELLMGQTCGQTAVISGEAVRFTGVTVTVRPVKENGSYAGVSVHCRLTARRENGGVEQGERLKELEREAAAEAKRRMEATAAALKAMNADGAGLRHRALEGLKWGFGKAEAEWPAEFADWNIQIAVTVQLER